MKAILSLLFLAILVFCTWSGYKRGLILGVVSLLIMAVSVYGASLLSTTYSGEIIDALRPFASGYVEVNVVDEHVRPDMGMDDSGLSTEDYLAQHPDEKEDYCLRIFEGTGIYSRTAEQLAAEAVEYAETNSTDLTSACVEVLCLRVSYAVGFLLAFLMILILLTVLMNLPNLSFKLPNHDSLNDIVGAVLGLVQGICLLMVLGWALKFTGLLFPQETLENTFLVSWFVDSSIPSSLFGI